MEDKLKINYLFGEKGFIRVGRRFHEIGDVSSEIKMADFGDDRLILSTSTQHEDRYSEKTVDVTISLKLNSVSLFKLNALLAQYSLERYGDVDDVVFELREEDDAT